jgi:hypothetical protein
MEEKVPKKDFLGQIFEKSISNIKSRMNIHKIAEKIFRFLCSLKLAVIVIVALGTIAGYGTIIESKYDAFTAQKLVYHSWFMYGVLGLLCVNLIAVAVDRLPWQKKHTGFVLAHLGIITLLLGSYLTHKAGIDGTMSFEIGEHNRYITTRDTEIVVYHLKDLETSEKVFSQDVDFLVKSPKKHPLHIPIEDGEILVHDYMPYAKKDTTIIPTDKVTDGPALRFQLQNNFVNFVEWILQSGTQPAKLNLGPAQIVLMRDSTKYLTLGGQNEIVIYPTKSPNNLKYEIYDKEAKIIRRGNFPVGGVFTTPWMNINFRAIQFYPKAQVQHHYEPLESPNAVSTSAAQIQFLGKDYWLGLDTALELYADKSVYFITYGSKRIDVGFSMTLNKFDVENYEGTQMAKSYQSVMDVPGLGEKVISMNEPLKHNGFTFYQSSFEQDRMGKPVASILSVNYDPGRWVKYLGSFLIIFGAIMLFYFKKFGRPVMSGRKAPSKGPAKVEVSK